MTELTRRTLAIRLLLAGIAAGPAAAAAAETEAAGFLTLDALKARYQRPGDSYAAIGGLSIRYRDEGSGRAIVLLHGSFGSLESWDGVADALSARYRVIRFDMPAHGLSSSLRKDEPTTTPRADDVTRALLQQLGVSRAVFVGVSSGGTISYHCAARWPDMVEALILSNAPADPVEGDKVQRSAALTAEFAEAKRSGFRRRSYWQTYLEWLAGDPGRMSGKTIDKYYDMNRRQRLEDERYFGRITSDVPGTKAALAGVRAPTLLVWGAKDLVLPVEKSETLRRLLTGATVSTLVMPDVGHYPPLEVPARFAAVVETFLVDVLAAPG